MSSWGVVILAAGAGRRLGGAAKALLRTRNQLSFLETVWLRSRAAGCSTAVVVVGGEYGESTRAEAERLGLAVVVNPDPSRGMASSVAVGFAYALETWAGSTAGALLWPVDHPHVSEPTVRRLLACEIGQHAIVIPTDDGRGGHPTLFAASVWKELASCEHAPEGARTVVRADANRVLRFDVQDSGVTRDIDTPADLS